MYYTCLRVTCENEYAEMLMAEVAEAGFDTFLETEHGFEAYVELEMFDPEVLKEIHSRYSGMTAVQFHVEKIQKKNWNEEWEKNYRPIVVESRCRIRASFHEPDPTVPLEVIITPKMSFGTGHHQTTYLMVKNQLDLDHSGKRVMDAGCGTAILSIVASKLGASWVDAFDIDEWSITNGNENLDVNDCRDIRILQGKLSELDLTGPYDVVLANINKNVLLEEMSQYEQRLVGGGLLLLSGFYENDIPDLLSQASLYGLHEIRRDEREGWASLLLEKRRNG